MPIEITHHKPIETIYWRDLTPEEQAQHYPLEDPDQAKHYIRFNNRVYYLPNFMRVEPSEEEFTGWLGRYEDRPYAGTLINTTSEDLIDIATYTT